MQIFRILTAKKLFTSGELARRLDLSPMLISRAIERGIIQPDFESGIIKLFEPAKLARIRRLLVKDSNERQQRARG